MTKKEYRKMRAEWQKALAEGRVVRMVDGYTMRTFHSASAAQAFVRANPEIYAEIVQVTK